jgi:DNA-binding NarL/FixJ family response regulator
MEEAGGNPSLVLVEQHEALRDGLAVLLERRGFNVLGCAKTAAQGEEVIREQKPDVAVVGIDLPDERGTELVRRISGNGVGSKCLIYTGLNDPALLEAAYRAGARGLVAKPAGLSVLVDALREVWRGGRYFDPSFRNGNGSANGHGAEAVKALSSRESEILGLLAEGLTGEEIAKRLVLSPETVRTHIRNAMEKLGAPTRTAAVVKALDLGEVRRN